MTPHNDLLAQLRQALARFTPVDGEHPTAISRLTFYRHSSPTREERSFSDVALIIAAQGAKVVRAGGSVFDYDAQRCLVTSVAMPISGRVTRARVDKPYLCFVLNIDMEQAADLVIARDLPPPDDLHSDAGLCVAEPSAELLEAVCRLARLLDTPQHIPLLAPLLEREIIYRLLTSAQGQQLRAALIADTRAARVARAVTWIKEHMAQPIRIGDLAGYMNMSVSSLFQHFKTVTSHSPLQYQKCLRLHEARRLLLTRNASDLSVVAAKVGYGNVSQFHREYKRLFGLPPMKDVSRLRHGAGPSFGGPLTGRRSARPSEPHSPGG
ncbi:AraC family transcriptional regulator N-terminal domain-containing protein [Pseudomonas tolaasii]